MSSIECIFVGFGVSADVAVAVAVAVCVLTVRTSICHDFCF